MALAESWEAVPHLPQAVDTVLTPVFPDIRPLLAIPELKVPLPGGRRESQTDLWVLARSQNELISIAVEGKVDEPFGEPVAKWKSNASEGKRVRWDYLKTKLGLNLEPSGRLMYQLFHRTVSAVICAEDFNARHAVMLVQSFSAEAAWFEDYSAFVAQFGIHATPGILQSSKKSTPIQLWFGWCHSKLPREFL
jgi:hypothetical protein